MTIGERVQQLRQKQNMTVLELAEAIDRDVIAVLKIEYDKSDVAVSDLIVIAKALNIPMIQFFEGVTP